MTADRKRFRGLGLGGPRDGQMLEHHAPSMPVPVRRSVSDWLNIEALGERAQPSMPVDVHRVLYRYETLKVNAPELNRAGPVEFGFWIPDGQPTHGVAIIARLMGGYRIPT